VALVGAQLWTQLFGLQMFTQGRTVRLNGTTFLILGVMPSSFRFPEGAEVWIPTLADRQVLSEAASRQAIARLSPGTPIHSANLALHAVLVSRYGEQAVRRFRQPLLLPLQHVLSSTIAPIVLFLALIVTLLLGAACANVAGLVLVRVYERGAELAVHRVLGASRRHLVTQILTEGACVAAIGAFAGWGLAALSVRAAPWATPPVLAAQGFDGRALLIGMGVATTAWLLFSIVSVPVALSQHWSGKRTRTGEALVCGVGGESDRRLRDHARDDVSWIGGPSPSQRGRSWVWKHQCNPSRH
jgi:hypothetical protein